jgi:hypothetical protein
MSRTALGRLGAALNVPVEVVVETILTDPNVLKAVRGGVAETMASRQLAAEPGVAALERASSGSDRLVVLTDGRRVRVEVKVVDATSYADGTPKVDLRRTTGERLYLPSDFEVLAACLLPVTGTWEYRYRATSLLARRSVDGVERLDPNVRVSSNWVSDLGSALEQVSDEEFNRAEQTRPQLDLGL